MTSILIKIATYFGTFMAGFITSVFYGDRKQIWFWFKSWVYLKFKKDWVIKLSLINDRIKGMIHEGVQYKILEIEVANKINKNIKINEILKIEEDIYFTHSEERDILKFKINDFLASTNGINAVLNNHTYPERIKYSLKPQDKKNIFLLIKEDIELEKLSIKLNISIFGRRVIRHQINTILAI